MSLPKNLASLLTETEICVSIGYVSAEKKEWSDAKILLAVVCVTLMTAGAVWLVKSYNSLQANLKSKESTSVAAQAKAQTAVEPAKDVFDLVAEKPAGWQAPQDEIVKQPAHGMRFLDEPTVSGGQNKGFDVLEPERKPISEAEAFLDSPDFKTLRQLPDFGNGLPAGKWASTLVAVETEANLFRDPATRKLYRVVNGVIFEETNPYAGLTLQELRIKINLDAQIAQMRLEGRRQQIEDSRQEALVAELRRANDIASQRYYQPIYEAPPPIRRVLPYSTPIVSAPARYVSPTIVTPVVTSYDPDSLGNPYGAGSPYKADGLMNPYSRYGSPYSSQSWRNPFATDTPKLYDSQGNYKGKLSSNPYDPDSTANPYGKYGGKYSPDSINNPYGLGSPYSTTPIYVVPSR